MCLGWRGFEWASDRPSDHIKFRLFSIGSTLGPYIAHDRIHLALFWPRSTGGIRSSPRSGPLWLYWVRPRSSARIRFGRWSDQPLSYLGTDPLLRSLLIDKFSDQFKRWKLWSKLRSSVYVYRVWDRVWSSSRTPDPANMRTCTYL